MAFKLFSICQKVFELPSWQKMASLLCRKLEYEIRWENTELLNTSCFSWMNPSANTATSAQDVLTLQIKQDSKGKEM